jgi:hypothetical protein
MPMIDAWWGNIGGQIIIQILPHIFTTFEVDKLLQCPKLYVTVVPQECVGYLPCGGASLLVSYTRMILYPHVYSHYLWLCSWQEFHSTSRLCATWRSYGLLYSFFCRQSLPKQIASGQAHRYPSSPQQRQPPRKQNKRNRSGSTKEKIQFDHHVNSRPIKTTTITWLSS